MTVTVTSPWNNNATSIYEGFIWSITFNGVSVQGDVPSLVLEDESITGDELGLIATSVVIKEEVKGNHAGFKVKFRDQLSYCIGWDSRIVNMNLGISDRGKKTLLFHHF